MSITGYPTPPPFSLVTALPSVPFDGQIVVFQTAAMAVLGLAWTLRYNAASSSAYKWEVIGGSPLYAEDPAGGNTASTTFTGTGSVPVTLALPLAGDYMVSLGYDCYNLNAASQDVDMSYDIGATGAVAGDGITPYILASGAGGRGSWSKTKRKNAVGAVTLTAKWRVSVGATGYWFDAWMAAMPIRVG